MRGSAAACYAHRWLSLFLVWSRGGESRWPALPRSFVYDGAQRVSDGGRTNGDISRNAPSFFHVELRTPAGTTKAFATPDAMGGGAPLNDAVLKTIPFFFAKVSSLFRRAIAPCCALELRVFDSVALGFPGGIKFFKLWTSCFSVPFWNPGQRVQTSWGMLKFSLHDSRSLQRDLATWQVADGAVDFGCRRTKHVPFAHVAKLEN